MPAEASSKIPCISLALDIAFEVKSTAPSVSTPQWPCVWATTVECGHRALSWPYNYYTPLANQMANKCCK